MVKNRTAVSNTTKVSEVCIGIGKCSIVYFAVVINRSAEFVYCNTTKIIPKSAVVIDNAMNKVFEESILNINQIVVVDCTRVGNSILFLECL